MQDCDIIAQTVAFISEIAGQRGAGHPMLVEDDLRRASRA